MFNKVVLVGHLTRDIEMRYLQGGTAIASTGIATSHKYTTNGKKREDTCFVDLTFFGRSAEIANQYLKKGSKVLVEGRLKYDTWEKDGQKRSKHSIAVESMQMLGHKQDTSNPSEDSSSPTPHHDQQQYQQTPQPYQQQNSDSNPQQYKQGYDQYTSYKSQPEPQQDNGLIEDEEIPF